MPKARFAPRSVLAFLFWSLVASLVPLSLAAQPRVPSTVSPGAHDRFDAVGDRCPTFSWSVVPGAVGYELALYALSDAVSEPSNGSPIEAPLARSLPILEHSIDAPATSWTPSLERCLHAVGSFGWAVRGRLASGAATDWSEPRLFELSDSARETDLEETLDLLERRLAADPSLADGLIDRLADRLADRLTDRVLDNVGWPVRQERSPAPRQVLTGTSEARPRPDQASADAIAGVPSSALAAGSIRIAGDFGFSTPRSGEVFVGAADFIPQSNVSGDTFSIDDGSLRFTAGSNPFTGDFVAPVRVPENASITSFQCKHKDTDVAFNQTFTAILKIRDIFGPALVSTGSTVSTSTTSTQNLVRTASGDNAGLPMSVDSLKAPFITLSLSQTGISPGLFFLGCTVVFTVEALQP